MLQSTKPASNNSLVAELAQLPSTWSHDPEWPSIGQIHVELIQGALDVRGPPPQLYVIVQFEQNEFVTRDAYAWGFTPYEWGVASTRPLSRSFVWNNKVSFDVTSEASSFLICNVYDRAAGNGFLGSVVIKPLLKHNHTDDQWYKLRTLENKVNGEMRVKIIFEQHKTIPTLRPRDFQLIKPIGQGTFGKVFQARKKDTRRVYALKVLSKEVIAKTEIIHTFGEEHKFLYRLQSPFLIGLKFSFQTDTDIYLATDFRSGGELIWHLQQETRFNEERARFYIAELILALEHLHEHDIIYRNLKPENVLLDATGHVALCHFGLSTADIRFKEQTDTFSGTTEYLAPEILLEEGGYSKLVDFWSLGVLLFEMCCGWSPFYADDTQQMYKNICFGKIRFPKGVINEDGKQFVKRLLNRNPKHRLGAMRGTEELKEHPFVSSIDWAALARKEVTPPFKPVVESEPEITDLVFDSDEEDSTENSFVPATFVQQHILSSSLNSTPPWQPWQGGIDIPRPKATAEMFPLHLPKKQFTGAPTFTSGAAELSNEFGYHLRAIRNVDDRWRRQLWSPVYLSLSDASTEYYSPYASLPDAKFEHLPEPPSRTPIDRIVNLSKLDLTTWFEKLDWFEPIPVDGLNNHFASSSENPFTEESLSGSFIESPSEPENIMLHDEVDHVTLEMTCGPLVEELFWPLRSRIRAGKFHVSALGYSMFLLTSL
ncbi:kinase-like domain-containing protein [Mycena metata]|uniref:Kinase-like domain-containing protein n=1 Tax=Mycena metata TaxID=1033252 RepID=A0AAD7MMY8_9AGAR|nr:kinase-like domain-containing protein [Mycena metata]